MAVFNEPTKWQTSLVNSGDANVIPQSTPVGTGEASFDDGFPQITQIPIGAGGIAPDRKDFNGLFKILGDWLFYIQNGGVSTYSESFDYVAGRVVSYNDNIYKCIQANGVSSTIVTPDSDTEYWQRIDNFVRSVNGVNADASGNVTITVGLEKADKDLSNVTSPSQAFKNMSIGWVMPDYSAKIQITASPFIAPSAGIVYLNTFSTASYDLITVNSINISKSGGNNNNGNSTTIIVNAGDEITIQNIASDQIPVYYVESWFVPFKGVVSNV